ncbi:N-acetylneuraminate 9-O-acetyltransferase [Labeo rohita]|uniref:N-acetylneuraminate 9-O-acetyltransferase n=1 Tax=Labeo rohita TaxID=84645 RepID=A0ABQ8M165_LABRO|nr:N-acetylneuraminate 9-O-acetyltransferase [Labeo rohita]
MSCHNYQPAIVSRCRVLHDRLARAIKEGLSINDSGEQRMAEDTLVSPQATATNSLVSSILLSSVWCFSLLLLSGNGLPADRQTHKHQHAPVPASRCSPMLKTLPWHFILKYTFACSNIIHLDVQRHTHIASFDPLLKPHIHMLVALQITPPHVMLLKPVRATNEPMGI